MCWLPALQQALIFAWALGILSLRRIVVNCLLDHHVFAEEGIRERLQQHLGWAVWLSPMGCAYNFYGMGSTECAFRGFWIWLGFGLKWARYLRRIPKPDKKMVSSTRCLHDARLTTCGWWVGSFFGQAGSKLRAEPALTWLF